MSDIVVNQTLWDAVVPKERDLILAGLRKSGSFTDGDVIVPSVNPLAEKPNWDPIGDLCRAACDVAAGAALAWCDANTAGAGTALCIAAAEAAREECRRHC